MAIVRITAGATDELAALPRVIRRRIENVFGRLERWPDVSGAKALRGDRAGQYRIRTGNYRIIFSVSPSGNDVTVLRVGIRRDIYED